MIRYSRDGREARRGDDRGMAICGQSTSCERAFACALYVKIKTVVVVDGDEEEKEAVGEAAW